MLSKPIFKKIIGMDFEKNIKNKKTPTFKNEVGIRSMSESLPCHAISGWFQD